MKNNVLALKLSALNNNIESVEKRIKENVDLLADESITLENKNVYQNKLKVIKEHIENLQTTLGITLFQINRVLEGLERYEEELKVWKHLK